LQTWKNSLKSEESNLILAQICVWYLLFAVFESHPFIQKMASGDENLRWYSTSLDKNIGTKGYDQYAAEHYFLDYAAQQ